MEGDARGDREGPAATLSAGRSMSSLRVLLAGAGFAATFADRAPMCNLGFSLFVVLFCAEIGEKTYTKASLFVLFAACLHEALSGRRSALVPALLVNFAAVCASFHAAWFYDTGAFRRMATSCGWSMPGFWARDFLVHVLPVLILTAWVRRFKPRYAAMYDGCGLSLGIATGTVHLLWAFLVHGGLNLSDAYIRFSEEAWQGMWFAAVCAHFLGACLWKHV